MARLTVKLAFLNLLHLIRLVDFLIVVAVKVVRVLVVRHVVCLELGREGSCQSGLLSENPKFRFRGRKRPDEGPSLFQLYTTHHHNKRLIHHIVISVGYLVHIPLTNVAANLSYAFFDRRSRELQEKSMIPTYREVQLDLTLEIEVFHMLSIFSMTSIKHHIG